jgi:outer membrane cobalamin receptor
LGFQAEWNVGRGPGLNDAQTEVIDRSLTGGYAMVLYRHETPCYGTFFPFARYVHYKGGYKPERNAPFSRIDEWEVGLEWQFNPQMELTCMYTFTDRTNTTAIGTAGEESYRQFVGQLLRLQFQVNY